MTNSHSVSRFRIAPAALTREAFVEHFGGVYEHSPWVADRTWQTGVDAGHSFIATLAAAMTETLDKANDDEKLQLIRAHPDLAGKAAKSGKLTNESTDEQSSAGLDQCSEGELAHFQTMNDAYKEKFDIPFIMAVRGSNRHQILAGFEERLPNEHTVEIERALSEINRIAMLR